jgi:exosortase/archaeosortase family protein
MAIIGLSTPDNLYNVVVDKYLNFIDPLRDSLIYGAKDFLSLLGIVTYRTDHYSLMIKDSGESVRMVYSCIGYGVMSFWVAFMIANKGSFSKKAKWIVFGLFVLWIINVLRLSLLLLALKKSWRIPFGWDHHTWFNILAYSLIFLMIYLYDRTNKATTSKK